MEQIALRLALFVGRQFLKSLGQYRVSRPVADVMD